MKPAAYLLTVLLLSALAIAADTPKQAQTNDKSAAAASATVPASRDEDLSAKEDSTCYTIRAYFFRPSEDGRLEPAGMATCVPSNQRALKRAKQKPAKTSPLVLVNH